MELDTITIVLKTETREQKPCSVKPVDDTHRRINNKV